MTWPLDADEPLPPDTSARRGRPPAPIAAAAGLSHRAWLEPLRAFQRACGITLDDLAQRAGFSKTRISELLRGNGYYPAWEITSSVIRALGLPLEPMFRLWIAGAEEAGKPDGWIDRSIQQVALQAEPAPLPYEAFTDSVREAYTAYARAFLLADRRAALAVAETFDLLWVSWNEAVASDSLPRFAWLLLRERVMARVHHHRGRPDLRAAAFAANKVHDDMPGHLVALSELTRLFDAIGRLPDDQMDITVLRYLCAVPAHAIPGIVGLSKVITHATDHHARAALEHLLPDLTQE
ncbi:helix-turn-helix transcriptional regulator [Streptomyces sp. NPDC006458]|uniref:helix-turn-helix domain-containing protein n=1 Tax=Streptomyces sp. NPDC006458 TaxID=3154302 RepID=UPI0033AE6503